MQLYFKFIDCAVFNVPSNTVQVIWETVFKTQPIVSKYWRRIYKGRHKQRKEQNTHTISN